MKYKHLTLILLTLFVIGLTSCSTMEIVMLKIYGVKTPKLLDEKTILHYSKKYDIPLADSYELDTSYRTFIYSFDTTKYKSQRQNHIQPLQALYFDKTGQLQSYHINCYAGGFPNLKWNRDSILRIFPPKQQAPVDSILPFNSLQKYLRPLSTTYKLIPEDYDYMVVVYWNRCMSRQSKRLIHFIQDNCKLAHDKKVKIIYVNNDNVFVGAEF